MKILFASSSLPRNFGTAFVSATKCVFDRLEIRPYVVAHFPTVNESDRAEITGSYRGVAAHCKIVFEEDPELPKDLLLMNENIPSSATLSGMQGNLYQWLSMKRCVRLIVDMEKEAGQFDWIIWARPDMFYFSGLERLSRLPPDALYFPTHDNWGGLNDRFCMGNPEMVKRRLGIFDYFVEKWYSRFHQRGVWNPETVLRDFVADELKIKIRRTRVAFGKLRATHVTRPCWDVSWRPNQGNIDTWLNVPIKTRLQLSLLPTRSYPKERLPSFPLDVIQKQFIRKWNQGKRVSEKGP